MPSKPDEQPIRLKRRRAVGPRLIGTYRTPRLKSGHRVTCAVRGEVEVDGIADTPIPWPYVAGPGGHRKPIVCDDLVRAVQTESVQALCYWWGVSRWTVHNWRRALGVGRMTEGTLARWSELYPTKLDAAAVKRGAERGGEAIRRKYALRRKR